MISLYDSQITDILPDNIKNSPEVQAISYAIQRQNQKILRFARNINVIRAIDVIPEDIIDLMAAELRTQYYSSELDINIKRNLVRNTIIWYMQAGTLDAVEKMITILFGSGYVEEWFDYNGEPYHFKINVDTDLSKEKIKNFINIIKNVKNTRSQLDGFNRINTPGCKVEFGSGMVRTKCIRIGG